MAKRHDERKCLRSLSKVCRIEGNHIIANVDAVIGIHPSRPAVAGTRHRPPDCNQCRRLA